MEDSRIVELYFERSEQAIAETDRKYGPYCYSIAYNILTNQEDAQECVSDTYYAVWNRIPPTRPGLLSAFLGKITRHISIDRWRRSTAYKRTGGQMTLALDELGDVTGPEETPEDSLSRKELVCAINRFLLTVPKTERGVFLCRYWYLDDIETIGEKTGLTRGNVSTMLSRTRKKLRQALKKEGLL